jgi:signal transduction histidine kinase
MGTGLGLSISNNIVETHKGKIRVSSDKEEGSTFTILIPSDLKV